MYPQYNQADPKKRIDLVEDETYLALSVGGVPGDAVDLKRVVRKAETNTDLKVDLENRRLVYENEAYTRGDTGATPSTIDMATLGQAFGLDDLGNVSAQYPVNGDLLYYDGTNWVAVTPVVDDPVSFLGLDENGRPVKTDSLGGGGGGSGSGIPIGGGYLWSGPENLIPSGFMPKDGRELNRSVYADLFSIIGTAYGAGDGSTTFNIPNTKGRTVVGVNSADTDLNARGKTMGVKRVTLTIDETPAHQHGGGTSAAGNHSHGTTVDLVGTSGSGNNRVAIGGSGQQLRWSFGGGIAAAGNHSHSFATDWRGGNGSHENMQPSLVETYIIRVI